MLLNWLIFGVPWQIQVLCILLIAAVILYVVGRVFGWDKVRPLILPVLAVLGAIGLYSKARQEGYGKRIDEEHKVEEWAENVAVEKRDEARKMSDDKLNGEVDKWTRP